jgi:hypothetical protein
MALAESYPETTRYYFKLFWGIDKKFINDDITYERAVQLIMKKDTYEAEELKRSPEYAQKKQKERRLQEQKKEEERREAERKKREEESARRRKEEEVRNLPVTLPACVSTWYSHSSSSLKHRFFYDYYSYRDYKDCATGSMWETWKLVWHFKNDPDRNVSITEHETALTEVTDLVEKALRDAFDTKTEYLTLVCITASTQRKTVCRYKEFAETLCKDLGMNNAFPHINVVVDGCAKREGGVGSRKVSYDMNFFRDKYVILFDDVRTTGFSLDRERRILEEFGAKVIGAITIAQTKH